MSLINDWQVPWIPYSHLREMYRNAQTYILEEDFEVIDLWRLMVRLEIDRLWAENWHDQIERARNYIGIKGYPCPLCVYDNGKFIASCEMHKEIDSLRREVNDLRKRLGMTPRFILTQEDLERWRDG